MDVVVECNSLTSTVLYLIAALILSESASVTDYSVNTSKAKRQGPITNHTVHTAEVTEQNRIRKITIRFRNNIMNQLLSITMDMSHATNFV